MNIQPGITHCDTIGDIFRNPILIRFIAEWYRINKDGNKLKLRLRVDGEPGFTPEYYEFIREIFEDSTDMERFLNFIREQLILNDSLYTKVKEVGHSSIIKALMSFDELNNQLNRVDMLTIKGVFQTKIAELIISSQSQPSYMEEDEGDDYPPLPIFYVLEDTLDSGMIPISSSGEILCRLGDGKNGHIVNVLGENRIFEVDNLGKPTQEEVITEKGIEVLDTREKVVERIKVLEQAIRYHYSDDLDVPEQIKSFYANESLKFEASFAHKRDVPTATLGYIHFGEYLKQIKHDLEKSLRKMKVTDTSQIDIWKESGHKPGISAELPLNIQQTQVPVRAQLRIVK